MAIDKFVVKQADIFGNTVDVESEKKTASSSSSKKYVFPKFSIMSGIDDEVVAKECILLHRVLQKNCIGANRNDKFVEVFVNESRIKRGVYDVVGAARDSLIKFYVNNN